MRQAILNLEESKIREVANAGIGRDDVLPFWFGESDEVTPDFIRQAAVDSLQKGETFYAHNLGLAELREAVAAYTTRLHRPVGSERIAITSGGVNALMLAMQMLLDAGDEVVAVTPVWPNLTAQPLILGARLKRVSLRPEAGAWTLDLQALLDAVTPATRLLVLNAPNNPDRLDADRGRAAGHPRPLPAHRHLDPRGRGVRAPVLRPVRQRLRAELPRHRGAGRQAGGGAQLFQELPDDGLAARLARHAPGDDARHGQADRVQHLVRERLHPARRGRGRPAHGRGHAARRRPPEGLPRPAGAAAAGAARGVAGHAAGRHVRLLPARRASAIRWRWPSGWWPKPAWASLRATRSRPRRRAGCAGASRRKELARLEEGARRLEAWLAAAELASRGDRCQRTGPAPESPGPAFGYNPPVLRPPGRGAHVGALPAPTQVKPPTSRKRR